jgi:hypothetical protein
VQILHWAYCLLFLAIVFKMEQGKHLTDVGVLDIVNLRASINTGLYVVLKAAFPQAIPVPCSLVERQEVPHEDWLAGFTTGEGSFAIRASKSETKVGSRVQLVFTISQHIRDEKLLKCFINYMGCGYYRVYSNRELGDYMCTDFSDIYSKIIPFFKKHPILGKKNLDFSDWSRAAEYIQAGNHLTEEGLNKILVIKANMNKGRILDN